MRGRLARDLRSGSASETDDEDEESDEVCDSAWSFGCGMAGTGEVSLGDDSILHWQCCLAGEECGAGRTDGR